MLSAARLRHVFAFFRGCQSAREGLSRALLGAGCNGVTIAGSPQKRVFRYIMDDDVQKSCWGLTAKAVVGFAVFLLLAWLISGGAEKAAVVVGG